MNGNNPVLPETTLRPVSSTTKPSIFTSTQPSGGSNYKCPNGDGYYPDKLSGCRKYYVCLHTGTQFAQINEFTCPGDLLFDKNTSTCNYPNLVVC